MLVSAPHAAPHAHAVTYRPVGVETKAFSRAMRIVDEALKGNQHNDDAALAECRRLLHPLRDVWASITPDACRAA